MIEKINRLKEEIEALSASKAEELENLRIKYLSKKGEISQLFNDFRNVAAENKREIGQRLNELKEMATEKINAFAKNSCNTTTCYMPYINAFFQPRKESDRPKVVPDGAVNFAFIGQFAETPRDTIFTTEYSMRTGMESVYTLLDIDRGVPEVWGSKYDVRELLRACYYAIDKKPITDIKLSFKEKMLLKVVMKKAKGTDVELLLKESGLIE